MRPGQTYIIIALLTFCINKCLAQQYQFVHYTQKDGLAHNRTKSIFQDTKGRLYIGTFGGLSIYDGTRFVNYTMDNGLASNVINQVIEMGNDSIWIIPNGNQVICLTNGKLKPLITADGYCPVINKLIKCSDGFYYALADEGLFRFQNNRFYKIPMKEKMGRNINQLFVKGIEYDKQLFITTDPSRTDFPGNGYMIVYDLKTGKSLINEKTFKTNFFAISPQNELLVATDAGLKTIDQHELKEGRIVFLPPPQLYRSAIHLYTNFLYFDRQINLWLITSGGILRIDPSGNHMMFTTKNGLPVNYNYMGLFQDRENIMWFLNDQTGISKLPTRSVKFYNSAMLGANITHLFTDTGSDSVLMLDALNNKIILQNSKERKEYSYRLPEPFTADNLSRVVMGKNKHYLSSSFNVYEISNREKGTVIRPTLFYTLPPANEQYGICYTLTDKNDNLILVGQRLRVIFNDHTSVYYDLGYPVAHNFVISDDQLWVSTRDSKLFVFRLHPEDPKNYFELLRIYTKELSGFSPRCITIDKQKNIWIGSREHGLFFFSFDKDLNIRTQKQVSKKNGLSDSHVEYLNCDTEGNIWVCSPSGLDRIKRKADVIVVENISNADNLFHKPINITYDKNNIQWVLTSDGILKIDPSLQTKNNFKAGIIFTEIKSGSDTLPNFSNDVSLGYKENDLEFRMAAPSFINEKRVLYSYRLEGSNNPEWNEPSRNSSIRLVNLAPGSYTLHAKAIFLNDLYPDSVISYHFKILPPWWQTLWFNMILIAAMVLFVSLAVKIYVRRKMEHQRMILEKHQAIERERTRIAGDMHDDLGAGLSTIKFLSEKIKQNIPVGPASMDAEKIAANSNNLVQKMNEIIWAMNEKNDTLEDLLFYTRSYAMEYSGEHQLQCTVLMPESIPVAFLSGEIRRNIFLIVKESLHNIVKHANATTVLIDFRIDYRLFVTIKDNGTGIKNKVYDKQHLGNGLKNMQKRMEAIGGKFVLLDDSGVTIKAELPLDLSKSENLT